MVQASVYKDLLARFEAGEADVLPVLVDALHEGVAGVAGIFGAITTRPTKRKGVEVPSEPVPNSYALVELGKSITLIGTRTEGESARRPDGTYDFRRVERPYVRTYRVGDLAEYDSFNLSYYGEILAIGEKTVTISKGRGDGRARLDLETFSWRNRRFDLANAQERNSDHFMYG